MALEITNITDEIDQIHTILFYDSDIILTLRYHNVTEIWTFDISYAGKNVYGVKLSLGTLHLRSNNFPFDFVCLDTSDSGIDAFKRDDFTTGRIRLYILEPEDMEERRGYAVEIQ
jgi:hypothetical protein